MKPIVFSTHALEQMADRGASQSEVEIAINEGEEVPAKQGRRLFGKISLTILLGRGAIRSLDR
jgi:hypothetical protein